MGSLPSPSRCSRSPCEVPELPSVTPHALAAALAAQWPTYLSFLLSFVTLLIAWVYHHRLLQGVHRASTRLLFTNGILLLVVSAVPFPTALLGAFLTTSAASVACAIYAGYIGLLNFTYNVLWWEVERPQRQTQRSGWRPPTSMLLSYLGFPCYLVAAGLAFWRPVVTLIICGALWVVWTIKAPMLTAESVRHAVRPVNRSLRVRPWGRGQVHYEHAEKVADVGLLVRRVAVTPLRQRGRRRPRTEPARTKQQRRLHRVAPVRLDRVPSPRTILGSPTGRS